MSGKTATSVRNAYSIGKKQCSDYIKERLCNSDDQRMSIYATVKKNRLALFRSKSIVIVCKVKTETTALKERIQLYSTLYVGCKLKQAKLDEFFRHENQEPSLSDYGSIHKPTSKTEFLKCLPQITGYSSKVIFVKYEPPRVDGCIINVAFLVQMNNPRTSKTFGEYYGIEISEKVEKIADMVERGDIVFDVYGKASRKRGTCEEREKNEGVRINIKKNTLVYRKFNQVPEVSENKTELFSLVADILGENFQHKRETIVATKGETAVSNHYIETKYLEPCNKEEADDRMFLHALEMSRLGLKKLLIVTVDTDVVVIALYAF